MKRLTVGVLAFLFAASAAYAAEPAKATRVPLPTIQVNKDRGEQCVEPTAEMRRNHMEKILHQRDETMHRGIRTTQHSLKNRIAMPPRPTACWARMVCESCHVTPRSH
jgi:hypothetical protein